MLSVNPRQAPEKEGGGKYKSDPCDDSADRLMEEPTYVDGQFVDGQLLRLRAGEERAEVQGVEKSVIRNPAPALHELLMHDGDRRSWPAEVDEA